MQPLKGYPILGVLFTVTVLSRVVLLGLVELQAETGPEFQAKGL